MQSSNDRYDIITDFINFGKGNTLVNDMTSSSERGIGRAKSFVRYKVEYEELVLRMQQIMARRLERITQRGTYTEVVEEEMETDDILQLLSSLQQTNNQNEITIQNLQSQLVDLATERDAANKKSHKLTKIMARHRAKHETELSQERKKFADSCSKHIEEARVLKWKVWKLGERCKRTEAELKKRPGLGQKLIDLESKCTRTESGLKKNTTKQVPTESTGTNSTASSTETPTDNLVRDKSRDEDNEISTCIPELINLSSSELKDQTLMKSDVDSNQEPDTLQDLREENEALYESIEEAMQISHYVNDKMEGFAQDNAKSVKVYEHRLAVLQTKLDNANKSNADMSLELCSWKEEVEVLTHGLEAEVEVMAHALEETKAAVMNMTTLKEKACQDTLEAYDACEILQVEVDILRKQASMNNNIHDDTSCNDEYEKEQASPLPVSHKPRTVRHHPWKKGRDRSSSILSLALSLGAFDDYNDVSDLSIMGDDDVSYDDSSIIGINECPLFPVT